MKAGVKKLLRAGMMPAKVLGSPCSGDGSHGEVKIEETDGSSRQKEYDLIVLVHGGIRPGSGRRAFLRGHSVLGRRSLDWNMAARTKRSVDQANSRSLDVEKGERACRSSDV